MPEDEPYLPTVTRYPAHVPGPPAQACPMFTLTVPLDYTHDLPGVIPTAPKWPLKHNYFYLCGMSIVCVPVLRGQCGGVDPLSVSR